MRKLVTGLIIFKYSVLQFSYVIYNFNDKGLTGIVELKISLQVYLMRSGQTMIKSKLLQMHNVGIVVESLENAISFFSEIGLKLEGRGMVEGQWAGRVTGFGSQPVEIARMVTPDGYSRLELSQFLTPVIISDHRTAPVNSLGYLRIMFAVDNIDELVSRLIKKGAELVGNVVQYEAMYRLCYIRGTEGLLIGLAEQLSDKTATDILEKS